MQSSCETILMPISAKPTAAEPERLRLWRAACVTYRAAAGRRGLKHPDALQAAVAEVKAQASPMDERSAADVAATAINWCSVTHTAWFWDGRSGNHSIWWLI